MIRKATFSRCRTQSRSFRYATCNLLCERRHVPTVALLLCPILWAVSAAPSLAQSRGLEAVVIIKSRPVGEPEATEANIVLKPPSFAERNSLGAKPAIADTQQIVRRTVRSRVSHAKKVRVNSRRTSSPSWKDKVWARR